MMVEQRQQGADLAAGAEIKGSNLEPQAPNREHELEMEQAFKPPKLTSRGMLPPIRPHLLNLPTVPPTGDQVFKPQRLWGKSHSNNYPG